MRKNKSTYAFLLDLKKRHGVVCRIVAEVVGYEYESVCVIKACILLEGATVLFDEEKSGTFSVE